MALQTFNYLNAKGEVPTHSSIGEGLSNYLKGKHMPSRMAEEQRKLELANALSQVEANYADPMAQEKLKHAGLENQYYGREKEAHIAQMLAAAHHQRTGGGLQGHARNIADLNKLIADPNVPQEYKDMAVELFKADIAKGNSLVDTRNQNMQFKGLLALPADQKEKIFGQYADLGIGPNDATELYNSKVTPELLNAYLQQNPQATMHEAVAGVVGQLQGGHGYGLPQQQGQQQGGQMPPMQQQPPVEPNMQMEQTQQQPGLVPADTRTIPVQPAMTGENRTQYNKLQGALAEEEYINPIITEAMAPYATKYWGYSPSQFFDTFKDDPNIVDKMARFYAARALQPEVSGNRAALANSSTAQEALREIKHDSLNAIGVMDWRVSPEAYTKTQHYISEWIQGMAKARGKGLSGQRDFINAPEKPQVDPGFGQVLQTESKKTEDNPLGITKRSKK